MSPEPMRYKELGIPSSTIRYWIRKRKRPPRPYPFANDALELGALQLELQQKTKQLEILRLILQRCFHLIEKQVSRTLTKCNAREITFLLKSLARSERQTMRGIYAKYLLPPNLHRSLLKKARKQTHDRKKQKKNSLSDRELTIMKRLATSHSFAHMGTRQLARFAQRQNWLHCTEQTWYRYLKSHKWNRPDRVVEKPILHKKGLLANSPNQYWHFDTSIWNSRNCFGVIYVCVDNYSRKILEWLVEESTSALHTRRMLRLALKQAKQNGIDTSQITFVSDKGSENRARLVRELIESFGARSIFARTHTKFSNNRAESVFRSLKTNILRRKKPRSLTQLRRQVSRYFNAYNRVLPHNALNGATPDEIYSGLIPTTITEALKEARAQAIVNRTRPDHKTDTFETEIARYHFMKSGG